MSLETLNQKIQLRGPNPRRRTAQKSEKSAEQGTKTPDKDMVISYVLFMEWTSRRFGAKIQASLITSATVSLAVQF